MSPAGMEWDFEGRIGFANGGHDFVRAGVEPGQADPEVLESVIETEPKHPMCPLTDRSRAQQAHCRLFFQRFTWVFGHKALRQIIEKAIPHIPGGLKMCRRRDLGLRLNTRR